MNKKNIIIIVLSILLIIAIGLIIYLVANNKEDLLKDVTGTVIVSDSKYIIINTETEDFIVSNIKGTYSLGDIVKITYENSYIEDISPKPIKAIDEELIKVNTDEIDIPNNSTNTDNNTSNNLENENSNNENNQNPNLTETKPETNQTKPPVENNIPSNNASNNSNQSNSNSTEPNQNNNNSNNSNNIESNADLAVLSYVNDYKQEMDSGNITDKLKSGFVTVIDFLFYKGTIRGYYFSDLTDTVKLKVLSLAMYFDTKIEKYFPGYKETISNAVSKVYTNIKAKIVEAYLNITTKICTNNPDLCVTAKEDFQSLKTNFGLTWDLLKDIAGDGLTNLKNWYEIWRET